MPPAHPGPVLVCGCAWLGDMVMSQSLLHALHARGDAKRPHRLSVERRRRPSYYPRYARSSSPIFSMAASIGANAIGQVWIDGQRHTTAYILLTLSNQFYHPGGADYAPNSLTGRIALQATDRVFRFSSGAIISSPLLCFPCAPSPAGSI